MFDFMKRDEDKLNTQIDAVLIEMKQYGPEAPEYTELLGSLERLYNLKYKDDNKRQISPEVVLTVVGNILCVLIIVGYEQKHVIASRAMTFIARLSGRGIGPR